jgi:hypothetical protein
MEYRLGQILQVLSSPNRSTSQATGSSTLSTAAAMTQRLTGVQGFESVNKLPWAQFAPAASMSAMGRKQA